MKAISRLLLTVFFLTHLLGLDSNADTRATSSPGKGTKIQIWVEQESKIGYRRIDHIMLDTKKPASSYNGIAYKSKDFAKVQPRIIELTKNLKKENKNCEAGRFLRVLQIDSQPKTFSRGCLESAEFKSLYKNLRALSLLEQKQ